MGLLNNVAVLGWRWLDFGRFGIWIVLAILCATMWTKRPKHLWYLWLIIATVLSFTALRYQFLTAHRYFLPAFLVFNLLNFVWVVRSSWSPFFKKIIFTVLALNFALGHFWVYPRGISMDWDSTLAHQPYHHLRSEAIAFLEAKNIDFKDVGSAFPNLNTGENLRLDGDERLFSPKNFDTNRYMFCSNVFNDFSMADYTRLQRDGLLLFRNTHAGVWIEIYQVRRDSIEW
jgi:hypothetical protein